MSSTCPTTRGQSRSRADRRRRAALRGDRATLEQSIADLGRVWMPNDGSRAARARQALDRDLEIHRLTSRLQHAAPLRARPVPRAHRPRRASAEPSYIGRLGLTDADGRRLLIDWRSPAAEPFFGATHANPMGLASRRRYRWTARPDHRLLGRGLHRRGARGHAPRSTTSPRSSPASAAAARAADARRARHHPGRPGRHHPRRLARRARRRRRPGHRQDRRRAAPRRVPALLRPAARPPPRRRAVRRAAPALPRVRRRRAARASARRACRPARCATSSPRARRPAPSRTRRSPRLKASRAMVAAIEPAVALYEEPPTRGMTVETPWARRPAHRRRLGRGVRRARARHPAQRGARRRVGGAARRSSIDKLDDDGRRPSTCCAERSRSNRDLTRAFDRGVAAARARPTSSATCGRCPAYLRRVRAVARRPTRSGRCSAQRPAAWTTADLPLLDAARQRLGDPRRRARRRRREAALAAEREGWTAVIDDLIAADDSETAWLMSMLRGEDAAEQPWSTTPRCRPPIPTCSPDRSRTSSSTRRRS